MLLHAGLDPALARRELTAEAAISGLHTFRTASTPGRICGIAPAEENNTITPGHQDRLLQHCPLLANQLRPSKILRAT